MSTPKKPRKTPTIAERTEARTRRFFARAGIPRVPPSIIALNIERAEKRASEKAEERKEALRARYADHLSVTAVARMVGVRRDGLFTMLAKEGWLARADVVERKWRATGPAIAAGFAVQRGRGAVTWVQITPRGVREIQRRFSVHPKNTESAE